MERSASEEREERIRVSRRRSVETLKRTITTVTEVIEQNRRLAEATDGQHRRSALRRIEDGQEELEILRGELEKQRLELAELGGSRREAPEEASEHSP